MTTKPIVSSVSVFLAFLRTAAVAVINNNSNIGDSRILSNIGDSPRPFQLKFLPISLNVYPRKNLGFFFSKLKRQALIYTVLMNLMQ